MKYEKIDNLGSKKVLLELHSQEFACID